jgi:hypothetical protein
MAAGSWDVPSQELGRTPVRVRLTAGAALEPGLLLFAAFVVRGLAEYAVQ